MGLKLKAIPLGIGIWTAILATNGTVQTFPVGTALLGAVAATLIAMALA